MTFRSAAGLALVACAAATPSASARATAAPIGEQVRVIVQDCTAHGRLTERYRVRALRRAKRTLPADVRKFSDCERAITQAIERGGRPARPQRGTDRVRSVINDCAGDRFLDHRFKISTLRRALRHLPADVVEYSDCEKVIRGEIRRRT